MEGAIANLPGLLEVCRRHGAILVVDDSHSTGVLGATGRGTAEHYGVVGEVDIITDKALGRARRQCSHGSHRLLTAAGRIISSWRLPPPWRRRAAGLNISREPSSGASPRTSVIPAAAGWAPRPARRPRSSGHPRERQRRSDERARSGPMFCRIRVPRGARDAVRYQISAAHARDHLDQALAEFGRGRELGLIWRIASFAAQARVVYNPSRPGTAYMLPPQVSRDAATLPVSSVTGGALIFRAALTEPAAWSADPGLARTGPPTRTPK
jgi:glycine C-acetyltransferase